jgi:hypothetical protein
MRGSPSENCARIRDLGYRPFRRLNMYGEHFKIVSDPFAAGGDVVVHAVSGDDPEIRMLRLPVSILLDLEFPKRQQPIATTVIDIRL